VAVVTGAARGIGQAIALGLTRSPGAEEGNTEEHFDDVRMAQAVKRSLVSGDMAGAVALLASDDMAMIGGQTLRIDGGLVTL
jgi:NAD(P)-dependent dehydrogenase (short-subunit alcohol dehydrogenase family)